MAIAGMPRTMPSKAAATVPEYVMSSPRLAPWLIPETIRSALCPSRPRSAKRTQSTGVPSVAKPVVPSSNSISSTQIGERVVMLRAVALRLESGAITCTCTSSSAWSARRSAWSPWAPIPSSFVIRTCMAGPVYEGGEPENLPRRAALRGGSAAAVDDDEVRQDADREAQAEHPKPQLAVTEAAHRVPHLADHIEDGSARDRIEGELERLRGDAVAEHGAEEGGCAADNAGDEQPAPCGRDVAQRADYPEALSRVVQGEADDQHGGEANLAGRG